MKNSILVTGGAGFIGSNFVLDWIEAESASIVNLDQFPHAGNPANLASLTNNPRHVFVRGDIGDAQFVGHLLAEHQPRAIVNFAKASHVDRSIHGPGEFIQTNIVGTFQLLEATRAYWGSLDEADKKTFRFLHASTVEVYDSLALEDSAFKASNPYNPNNPYSACKAALHHLVRSYHYTYGLPVLTTNYSNNYGPYDFPQKLIPLVIQNALEGKPLPIYGGGQQIRDWLFVRDHCFAIRCVLEAGRVEEIYNIGGWNKKTNLDVVHKICGLLDELAPRSDGKPYADQITSVTERPDHDRHCAIDASKMNRELGWKPAETFESGLRKTVQWYLENQDWVKNATNGNYQPWIDLNFSQDTNPGEALESDRHLDSSKESSNGDSVRNFSREQARQLRTGTEHYSSFVGPTRQWDFMGATQFRLLTTLGLRENHRVLDVGCGSLRAGRLFIPYLNPGCYCGIEPNMWLVEDAVTSEIGPELIARKKVRFSKSKKFEANVFEEQFDFILAQSIFSHAGPDLLKEALPLLKAALAPGGLILATFLFQHDHPGARAERLGWTYPGCITYRFETVMAYAADAQLTGRRLPWYHPRQSWMAFAIDPQNLPSQELDRHLTGAVLRDPEFVASISVSA